MLKTAPDPVGSLIKEWWEAVGRTNLVSEEWRTELLTTIRKKWRQDVPGNYMPVCMLSHIRKVIEKVIYWVIEERIEFDQDQFGFQSGINVLQVAVEVRAAMKEKRYAAVLDMSKEYDRMNRGNLLRKLDRVTRKPNLRN